MNIRVLLILFIFLIWCIVCLWWYHDAVICNCGSKAIAAAPIISVDSLKKDSSQSFKSIDTLSLKTDSTTSVKTKDTLFVFFPVGVSKIIPNQVTLRHIKEMVMESGKSGKGIEITGHSDSKGSAELNMQLSAKRAEWLKNQFLEQGAPSSKVFSLFKGLTEPIAENTTAEGRSKNRRAVVVLK